MRRRIASCCCLVGDGPADKTEPGEAVVEGVAPGQSVVTVLHSTAGELCSTVVHFSHQVQSLPAGGSIKIRKKTFTKGLLICNVCALICNVCADGSNWDIKTELK